MRHRQPLPFCNQSARTACRAPAEWSEVGAAAEVFIFQKPVGIEGFGVGAEDFLVDVELPIGYYNFPIGLKGFVANYHGSFDFTR